MITTIRTIEPSYINKDWITMEFKAKLHRFIDDLKMEDFVSTEYVGEDYIQYYTEILIRTGRTE